MSSHKSSRDTDNQPLKGQSSVLSKELLYINPHIPVMSPSPTPTGIDEVVQMHGDLEKAPTPMSGQSSYYSLPHGSLSLVV